MNNLSPSHPRTPRRRALSGGSRLRRLFAIACGLAAAPGLAQTDPPAPTFTNVTVHDPSVMRTGDTYYVYGSHLASASSTDLLHWTQISTSPAAGNPLVPNPAVTFSAVLTWAETNTFWAPDVIRLGDGRYYMYYCACRGDSPRSALGLAVADSPTGPFSHVAVLLRSGMWGLPSEDGTIYDATVHPNVVDPAVFFDQAGRLWMVYGSYSGGIFILEMNPATGLQLPGQGYGKKLIGGNHSRIEGAYVLYSPESEYYYLFLSFGGLDAFGGYNIRVGRSRQPDGPYLDAAGTDLVTVRGAPGTLFDDASIAPHGVKLMGGYQFLHAAGEPGSTSRGYVSPGHNSAHYDPATGQYQLVFHTRFVGRGEQHEVRVHPMFINADDWPVVAPHRYGGEVITAANPVQVPGTYKLVNHGKAITATVSASANITLQPNGSVTGASAGTWTLSGEYDVTLTLGGTIYRGVFIRQWDDDSQRWVLAFSALSGNGVAVWGSKLAIPSGPAIVTPPAQRTVRAGETVEFTVIATADPLPTYQWQRNNSDLPGATGPSLTIAKATAADAGDYRVVLTNSAGAATSAAATLTVETPPVVASHPVSVTQPPGSAVELTVTSADAGVSYQWFKDGVALGAATGSSLAFADLQPLHAGNYTVALTASGLTTMSRPARVVVAAPESGRIVNMSVRSTAGINGSPLIVGFVMHGGSKSVLVRAIGPELATYSVTGFLPDPELAMHASIASVDTIVGTNDNWGDDGQSAVLAPEFTRLGAFPLPNAASLDAALLTAVDGARTVHANAAASGATGVVLVETYDAGDGASPRLVNISARNRAGSGFETLIAGFVISGNAPKRVLIRGVGPTLADYNVPGVLEDPRLEVHTTIANVDTVFALNDDWNSEPGVTAASTAAGAFPLRADSTDAAIVMTLPAGSYTALVSGVNATTGEALVEVYELE